MYLLIRHPKWCELRYVDGMKQGAMTTTFGKQVNIKVHMILNLTFVFLKVFLLFPFTSVIEAAGCTLTQRVNSWKFTGRLKALA